MKKTDGGPIYLPIACDIYSELEAAIMHQRRLKLMWHEGNVCFAQQVMPLDLQTQAGEEFLHVLLPSGERTRIRLDRLQRIEPA